MTAARKFDSVTREIASGAALSSAIDMRPYAAGVVQIPSAITAAGLGFHVCNTIDGTFVPLYDHTDALVEIAALTVSRMYELPPEIFACAYVKLWSQTSGSGVNQGADRTFIVGLKS